MITTIALALGLLFWTMIDKRLEDLESRVRCVEQRIVAISVQLGIDTSKNLSKEAVTWQKSEEEKNGARSVLHIPRNAGVGLDDAGLLVVELFLKGE